MRRVGHRVTLVESMNELDPVRLLLIVCGYSDGSSKETSIGARIQERFTPAAKHEQGVLLHSTLPFESQRFRRS